MFGDVISGIEVSNSLLSSRTMKPPPAGVGGNQESGVFERCSVSADLLQFTRYVCKRKCSILIFVLAVVCLGFSLSK